MRQLLFYILILLYPCVGNTQVFITDYDSELSDFAELTNNAKKYSIKSLNKFEGSKLVYTAKFNVNGELVSIKDYKYRHRHYEYITFKYENGNIIEFDRYVSFQKKTNRKFILKYDDSSRLVEIVKISSSENLYCNKDTSQIFYLPNGKINYTTRLNNQYSTYFFYNERDSLINQSSNPFDSVVDIRIFNEYGCLCGYNRYSDDRFIEFRDENCRLYASQSELFFNGKWKPSNRNEYRYKNDVLVEQKYYESNKKHWYGKESSKIKLVYTGSSIYEYNSYGLLLKIETRNKKEKLARKLRIEYEYFNMNN